MSVPDDVDQRATLTDLDTMLGELSVSKSAQRLKHTNIRQQTRNDTCQKVIQSKTQKKSKAKKSFFTLAESAATKIPAQSLFYNLDFFEKV